MLSRDVARGEQGGNYPPILLLCPPKKFQLGIILAKFYAFCAAPPPNDLEQSVLSQPIPSKTTF